MRRRLPSRLSHPTDGARADAGDRRRESEPISGSATSSSSSGGSAAMIASRSAYSASSISGAAASPTADQSVRRSSHAAIASRSAASASPNDEPGRVVARHPGARRTRSARPAPGRTRRRTRPRCRSRRPGSSGTRSVADPTRARRRGRRARCRRARPRAARWGRARRSADRSRPVRRRASRSPWRLADSRGPRRVTRSPSSESPLDRRHLDASGRRDRVAEDRSGSSPRVVAVDRAHDDRARRGVGPTAARHRRARRGTSSETRYWKRASPSASNCTGIGLPQRRDPLGAHCSATAWVNGSKPSTCIRSTVSGSSRSATSYDAGNALLRPRPRP